MITIHTYDGRHVVTFRRLGEAPSRMAFRSREAAEDYAADLQGVPRPARAPVAVQTPPSLSCSAGATGRDRPGYLPHDAASGIPWRAVCRCGRCA